MKALSNTFICYLSSYNQSDLNALTLGPTYQRDLYVIKLLDDQSTHWFIYILDI